MRMLVLVPLVLVAACGDFFTPPCTRVARQVCDVGSEGDSCAFILAVDRGDSRAQKMCSAILPAAKELNAHQSDPGARAAWLEARTRLGEFGMKNDPMKGRIENKLKAAGGTAGRIVEKAEAAHDLEESRVNEAAGRIFDDAAR